MASSATTARVTRRVQQDGPDALEIITVTWIAHTDGTFTNYTILGGKVNGVLERIITDPGVTAPTSNYDITVLDEDGIDVLGGGGMNRHASTTEEAACPLGSYFLRTLSNVLTLAIANNAVNGATGTLRLYVRK